MINSSSGKDQIRPDLEVWDLGSPTRQLLEVIDEETHRVRLRNTAERPEAVRGLLGGAAIDIAAITPWHEFLTDPEVVAKCAERLGIDQLQMLDRICTEITSPNWQVFFWMRQFYRLLPQAEALLAATREYAALQARTQRSATAKSGGHKKDELLYAKPREFVRAAWRENLKSERPETTKTPFALAYVSIVMQKFKDAKGDPLVVRFDTIMTWLKGM